MKARPILFNGDMVRAILDGRKTQTRRVIKPQPSEEWQPFSYGEIHGYDKNGELSPDIVKGHGVCNENGDDGYTCPFGAVGDLLWVRETIQHHGYAGAKHFVYSADGKSGSHRYQFFKKHVIPSIFMPRYASRITLEITGVGVERLRDISEADAIAEGITMCESGYFWWNAYKQKNPHRNAIGAYRDLWKSINGAGSWDANPWVWVIDFKPHFINIDAYLAQQGDAYDH